MAKKRQTFFTLNKLKNDVFQVTENERYVFMPNEIFNDLLERFSDEERAKSSTHIAFAYAYTYLSHYMYRYCKYEYRVNYYEVKNIDEAMIKQILGFPAKSHQYTYITKKGGILDELGYISKEGDKPISFYLSEEEHRNREITHFSMESEYPETFRNRKNRKINFPVKAFHRYEESIKENLLDGTFWETGNTHNVEFNVFMYCMSQPELGVEGFYLYSYLLFMCDKHSNSFDCSIERFVAQTGLGVRTVRDQLTRLEKRNMITNDHKPYCLDKKPWQIPKSNTYGVLHYSEFILNALEFKEIPKQRKISAKSYAQEIGFVNYVFCKIKVQKNAK